MYTVYTCSICMYNNYMYNKGKMTCDMASTGGIYSLTHSLVASVLPSESLVLPGLLPVSTIDRQSKIMCGLELKFTKM